MIESRRGMLLMGACDQTQFGAHSLRVLYFLQKRNHINERFAIMGNYDCHEDYLRQTSAFLVASTS